MWNHGRVALTIALLAVMSGLAAQLAAHNPALLPAQDPALHPALETTGERPRVAERGAKAQGANQEATPHQGLEASASGDPRRLKPERRGLGAGTALVPARAGVETAAPAKGDRPDDRDASPSNRIAPRALFPPRGQILADTGESIALRVTPAEASGEVLLADDHGEIFGRHPIPLHPASAGRVLDLHLALPPEDSVVWLAHENPDGRRSAWRAVTLEEKP